MTRPGRVFEPLRRLEEYLTPEQSEQLVADLEAACAMRHAVVVITIVNGHVSAHAVAPTDKLAMPR